MSLTFLNLRRNYDLFCTIGYGLKRVQDGDSSVMENCK